MSRERSSPAITLRCSPEQGVFSVLPHREEQPGIAAAVVQVAGRSAGRRFGQPVRAWQEQRFQAPAGLAFLGPAEGLSFQAQAADWAAASLHFIIPQGTPLLLWKIELENRSELPVQIDRIDLLRPAGGGQSGLRLAGEAGLSFYANGWQSWSYSATYASGDSMPGTRLGLLQRPMVYSPSTPDLRQPGYFTSDFFGVLLNQRQRTGLLAGFLSQHYQFGTIEAVLYDRPSLRMWASGDGVILEPGTRMETDWAVLMPFDQDQPDTLAPYLDAVAAYHSARSSGQIPTGWCSWYRYYTRVTADDVQENLAQMASLRPRLPLQLVQIDDGWQVQVGDWLETRDSFPQGMAPLSSAIRAAGKTPGLWLAPFIVHPRARLAREHPDWLLRDRRGRPVRAGFVWNSLPYALDLTHQDALDYARRAVRTAVKDWGFQYLKLDFLYAAALSGRYQDPTQTRAQVLQLGMRAIREAAGPETFLLGCGLPLGSAVGWVNAMRISADVGESWTPSFGSIKRIFQAEVHMPSARNAIHNSLTRSFLHRRWWTNDPDCLLVRPDTALSQSEVETLAAVIALTGGSLLLSDDLPALPAERLELAQALLPPIGQRAQVMDIFDQRQPARLRLDLDGPEGRWHLLARFNWRDTDSEWTFSAQEFGLPAGGYLLRSFWDRTVTEDSARTALELPLPAHGVQVLAARQRTSACQYAGSSLHISQGIEVAGWEEGGLALRVLLELPRQASGRIVLKLPSPPVEVTCNQAAAAWRHLSGELYEIQTVFDRRAAIEIQMQK